MHNKVKACLKSFRKDSESVSLMGISPFSYSFIFVFTPELNLLLYARYLCSRDALGLKAGRPSAARDDRVSCIQNLLY